MKRVVLTLVVAGVAACADTTPLAPAPAAAPANVAAARQTPAPAPVAAPALEDALDRLAASFGEGPDAAAARVALRQIIVQRGAAASDDAAVVAAEQRATEVLEQALARLAAANPELAAEIDAIRLAVDAERQHKPF